MAISVFDGFKIGVGPFSSHAVGLAQVPCTERNAVVVVNAINAAQMALCGDGMHFISLVRVIRALCETRGGSAVSSIGC